ncbi:hypothetical protein Mycch_0279 [Mycolicibacterium chubuense NBB4]|uniref:Uncharacterized protein n=1 Tax=Mycolicibacterium chubuense (strain NBB4) TaxID=710421 RepID=I4BCU7_MYCCN|nr:hypothetical protein [Mycolicibacterium chubuense]AFM15104.1 hypothetical protein Mycch_0279 [Mycolicibacterium chubuense NBB4]
MAKQYDIVAVAVEDLRRGDALTVSGETDPRTHVFYVARVDTVHSMDTGEVPRVVLTSEPVGENGEPMVLEYPLGTQMRKIVGIKKV